MKLRMHGRRWKKAGKKQRRNFTQIYLYRTGGNARIVFPGPCFKQISHKPLTFFGLSLSHCDFFARKKNRKPQPTSKPCLLPIGVALFDNGFSSAPVSRALPAWNRGHWVRKHFAIRMNFPRQTTVRRKKQKLLRFYSHAAPARGRPALWVVLNSL